MEIDHRPREPFFQPNWVRRLITALAAGLMVYFVSQYVFWPLAHWLHVN